MNWPLAVADVVDAFLVAVIAVVLSAPVLARVARRTFDPFEPIVLFALAYGAMFVVRPMLMIAEDSRVHEAARGTLDVSESFTEMLLLALFGAVAFIGAYSLPQGSWLARRSRPPRKFRSDRGLVTAAVVVAGVGALAYGLVLSSNGLGVTFRSIVLRGNTALPTGSAAQYGSYLFLVLVPSCLVLLLVGLSRRNGWLIAGSAAVGGCFLAVTLPVGGRIGLLPFAGGLFAMHYIRRSRRPSLAVLAAVAALALLGSTVLSDLRARTTRNETIVDSIGRSVTPTRLTHVFAHGSDTEMAPALAAALSVVPERLPHSYGATIVGDLVTRPIPRSLWDAKPEVPRRKLLQEIWPAEFTRGTINAEFSALVYFYWDFGLIGVLLGFALYGTLFRYAYEYFMRFSSVMYAQVLFALLMWFVVIAVRDGPVDTLIRAFFVLGPVWLLFAVASRQPASSAVRPSTGSLAP